MSKRSGTYQVWRIHETVRPGLGADEIIAMTRRGELHGRDRLRKGSGPWRSVGSLAALKPVMESDLAGAEVTEVLSAIRSDDRAAIELGLAKARALGLFGAPWLAAAMLETVLRLRDDEQLPTVLAVLDVLASWGGALGLLGRALHDSQHGQSCHLIEPSELLDHMVSDSGHARLFFDVMRRMVTEPRMAAALAQRLWDQPDPDDSDASWIRSVLRSVPAAQLLAALADHEARFGGQSVFLEVWMLEDAVGTDPAGRSWGGHAHGMTTHRRSQICIHGGGRALTPNGVSTLLAWFEAPWWESLTLRSLSGGAAAVLQAAHDGLVLGNAMRLEETEEFQEDDDDERMKAGQRRLIAPTPHVLRIELSECTVTQEECAVLRPSVPSAGYFTMMEVRSCRDFPDQAICWLAAHAYDAGVHGEDVSEWELESRSGTLSLDGIGRSPAFDGVRGSPLIALVLSDVPLTGLPEPVMRGIAFPRLQALLLNQCGLSSLRWGASRDSTLGPLTLRKVDFRGNRITAVGREFTELPKVESIDLSDNAIRTIDPRAELERAKSLTLAGNPLRAAPDVRFQTDYDLSGTLVTDMPCVTGDSCDLQRLTLPSTLQSLPSRIADFEKLKSLTLEEAQLASIPAELFLLSELESVSGLWGGIDLVGVERDEGASGSDGDSDEGFGDDDSEPPSDEEESIEVDVVPYDGEDDEDLDDGDGRDDGDDAPETIDDRRDRTLSLRISMRGMPPAEDDETDLDLGMVASARWIQAMIDASGHVALPRWITRLDVIGLWLSSFGGACLPDWLLDLPELREIHLTSSRVEDLPERLFTNPLMELIACDSPALVGLPDLGESPWGQRLETLDLMGSGVASLPDTIASATGLRHLLLNDTRIDSLPQAMMGMAIERLSINGCPIRSLPKGRIGLPSLETFEAVGSRLESLPSWIGECTSLCVINLRGVPLRSVPRSILSCTELDEIAISRSAPLDEESRAILAELGRGRVRYCSPDD